MSKQVKHFYEFGPFRLEPEERQLLRQGVAVPLTPKAFDMLLVLVGHSGHLMDKEELMKCVWPGSFVEEANLSHHIHKLREVLGEAEDGEKYIQTVPRRGYRFVAHVTEMHDEGVDLVLQEHSHERVVVEESEDDHTIEAGPFAEAPGRAALPEQVTTRKQQLSPRVWIGAAVCLVVLIIAGYFFWTRHKAVTPVATAGQIHSLAVLPFKPLSAESRDESLELGIADALITKLSNVKQIIVRPTSAILKYENSDQDLLADGREQEVDAVFEGKVQRLGNQIRLTAQLVRVSDGNTLWAGTFNDQFTNIFTMEDSISAQVAESLVARLTGDEQQRIAKHYTDNIEAYQLYQKGRLYWYRFTPEGVEKSIDYFNQAIALDPNYALAYAGLSFAYSAQGAIGARPPLEVLPKSKDAARTALRLDDNLAEAHVAMGGKSLFYERDWSNAEKEFQRAIELNPNQTDAHELLGYYWEVMKQYDKAGAELKNAQRIAPLVGLINSDVAGQAYYEHHYDEAIALGKKAHELDPDFLLVSFLLGQAYERKGQYEQAINECKSALVSFPDDPNILSALAYADARAGKTAEAQAILNKFLEQRKQHYVPPFMIALVCVGLDKKDDAFGWLNKAFEERDPQLIWVAAEPQFDELHSDQRFTDLLRRMNIAP
jgi:DNA-binding winged helix-turn-helix (wHTH) protein/TolB-like protein/Tfp pilus assembly protein PilF